MIALLILFSCLACLISKATRASVISAFSKMRLVRLCLKAWETSLILSGVEIDYFLITLRGILRSVSILSSSILFFIFLILVSYVPKKSTSISSLLFSESELLVSTLSALDYFLLGPDVRIDSDCFTLISGLSRTLFAKLEPVSRLIWRKDFSSLIGLIDPPCESFVFNSFLSWL